MKFSLLIVPNLYLSPAARKLLLFGFLLTASFSCSDREVEGGNEIPVNTYPSSGLFLGNSITVRNTDGIWWVYWGMAASAKQKDYVHVFETMAQKLNPGFSARFETIRPWEADPVNFDLSKYSPLLDSQPEFVVIKDWRKCQSK